MLSPGDERYHFARLLDFEIRVSDRYKRYVSLIMIASGNGPVSFSEISKDIIRISDELTDFEGASTLLMPETDMQGAMTAIGRFKTKCNGAIDLRFGVATFPADGVAAYGLLDKVVQRLVKARAGGKGEVVATG